MSLHWLTIDQIGWGVTRLNFSAFGGMKEEIRNPAARWGAVAG